MEAIILLIVSISNIICFFLGAKIGQRVVNNQPVRIIDKSPIESIREKQDSKELKKQQEIDDVIKHNIDVYDGTSLGQKDIPR
jgi:hypothetical protein|nr:MAG TPA: hypothetical protein [Caudoviricetes sp.]DAQ17874.1 MAG TPA: hypothetical protein [Caudoviricetes sp.]